MENQKQDKESSQNRI